MVKIVITAKVEDTASWERKFRTHGDFFKDFGISSPISYAIGRDNEVAIIQEVTDVETFEKGLASPETEQAMSHDGVIRESFKYFVVDKDFSF